MMKTKLLMAALALGSAAVVSNVSFAADKEAKKTAGKGESKAGDAKSSPDKADDSKGTGTKGADAKPADAKASEAKSGADADSAVKLTKPWSDIESLTGVQKEKIAALHKKALAEINAIEKKEKDDITAVLTEAQRAEMKDAADKKKKDAAAKRAAEKKAESK